VSKGWLKRLATSLLLFLFIAGPTPGAVGSCGEEVSYAPLVPYCEEREQLVCWRRYLRGELPGGQKAVDACRRNAIELCRYRAWSPDCRPTTRQANACINALESYDTLELDESRIPECSTESLCRVKVEPLTAPSDAGDASW
jgi:hypothetical protein